VVVPVRDDRAGFAELLSALSSQTRLPDELVVVDGGSTDGTLDELEGWSRAPVRLLVERGSTIGAARNAGIRAAASEWIACVDAGCRPVPGWLSAIDRARATSDFVASVVVVDGHTPLHRVLAVTHYPRVEELGDRRPLVRLSHLLFGRRYEPDRAGGAGMAFSRTAWLAAGGFPEHLGAGEDRAFTSAVETQGSRIVRPPEAAVRWAPPATWRANARMFMRYSRGDIRIRGRGRHALRAVAWGSAGAAVLGGSRRARAAAAVGALGYVALPVWRARAARLPAAHWWRIPAAVAVKDLSQIAGAALGLADDLRGSRPDPGRPP
jgi:cellulose synthase/poly-beta-1,6-N-acetylglucosamine synthase-like glycosyltransferase